MKLHEWFLIIAFITFSGFAAIKYAKKEPEKEIVTAYVDHFTPMKWEKMNATGYNCVEAQTDATPFGTASGFTVNKKDPLSSRVIALPKSMIRTYTSNAPYDFGDSVVLASTDPKFPYNGIWVIHDVCRGNVIDICMGIKDSNNLFKNIFITKFND